VRAYQCVRFRLVRIAEPFVVDIEISALAVADTVVRGVNKHYPAAEGTAEPVQRVAVNARDHSVNGKYPAEQFRKGRGEGVDILRTGFFQFGQAVEFSAYILVKFGIRGSGAL
jgi:hypothetical protein